MENLILKSLKYFSFFDYPPNFEEIYTFLRKKTTKKTVEETLVDLERQNQVKKIKDFKNVTRYMLQVAGGDTVGEYGRNKAKIKNQKSKIEKYNQKYLFSQKKLANWQFRLYVKILSFFPQIKLVGLSGSISMMNASEKDDIDLFIITSKNQLFTGRFIAIILAKILMIHRLYTQGYKLQVTSYMNKVCLNLFFDESNLAVPKFKRSEYVAHEVLQMKPIVNKSQTYERFIRTNRWVFKLFPNAESVFSMKYKVSKEKILNTKYFILDTFSDWIEILFKNLQLFLINRHKTTELITSTQLWFHPEDFGKNFRSLI